MQPRQRHEKSDPVFHATNVYCDVGGLCTYCRRATPDTDNRGIILCRVAQPFTGFQKMRHHQHRRDDDYGPHDRQRSDLIVIGGNFFCAARRLISGTDLLTNESNSARMSDSSFVSASIDAS
jgi:hypothetical protein